MAKQSFALLSLVPLGELHVHLPEQLLKIKLKNKHTHTHRHALRQTDTRSEPERLMCL